MRQLAQMVLIDVRMSLKSFVAAYMLVAPLLILVVFRLFIPSVQGTTATIAAVTTGPEAVAEDLLADLDRLFDLEHYETVERMEARLRGAGTVEGLYREAESGTYVSVVEEGSAANERFSVGAAAVRQYLLDRDYPDRRRVVRFQTSVPDALLDRTGNSPVATNGGAIFITLSIIITAFSVGLSVVNDKEYGTDRALKVTPLTRVEYYVAKAVLPVAIMLIYPAITVLVLGLEGVNLGMLYLSVILAVPTALVLGLFLGAMATNETEAMGVGKTLSTLVLLAILGGVLLPAAWQWTVYWVPVYWLFDMVEGIFSAGAVWTEVLWKSGVMVGTTAVYFLLARRRFAKGLS